jgi:DNA-binding response OmpR family regulator
VSRLLLVEDDDAIAVPLVRALEAHGYEVEHVTGGGPAVERVARGDIDLMILDLTLPDHDGLDVCREVRADGSGVQILMLTARTDELDLVVGLDAGADDYVTKPFRLAELLARVRARLREASDDDAPTSSEASGVRVDHTAHRAFQDGRELDLTPTEFDLLALLVGEAGRAVPRGEIMEAVWGPGWYGSSRTLDVHISALRRKLGDDPNEPGLLTTVRSVGFRFEP